MLTPAQARDLLGELIQATRAPRSEREQATGRLSGLRAGDLVRLDDAARAGGAWGASPWSTFPARAGVGLHREALVVALASMHPDGHRRQEAVRILAAASGPALGALPAALLALRLVDHVAPVRAEAATGLAARGPLDDAVVVLPVLLVVAGRAHGPAALARYADLLSAPAGPRVLLGLLGHADRRTRRWAFDACRHAGLLSVADLLSAARHPHDQVLRRSAAAQLADPRRQVEPDVLRLLLSSRYADARATAVTALPEEQLTDADLRTALLDRSPRVGDAARWRARRRGSDPAAVYRDELGDSGRPSSLAVACLAGLLAVGDDRDVPAVEQCLEDPVPSVRAAAVRAVAVRAAREDVATLLGPLLLDRSPKVVAATARALAVSGGPTVHAAEEAAWASAQPWSRRAAWRLARARGGWDRLEADLRAAADNDTELAAGGRDSVSNWLLTSAATTWHRPGGAQTDRLAELLVAAGLDAATTRLIAFHAGLGRAPSEDPVPSTVDSSPRPGPPGPRRRNWRVLVRWWR